MGRVTPASGSVAAPSAPAVTLDFPALGVRKINAYLHAEATRADHPRVAIANPGGAHNLAVGLNAPIDVEIMGHAGYYAAGMNKLASVTVHGNVERGVAENMMSGTVRVKGNASEAAGASMRGGLLVIEGNASGRCAISLKGGDVVVGGDVGHLSAFMAQAGRLVVCGSAGPGLGDSLYEAVLYVRGELHGLGADAREEPLTADDVASLTALLAKAGFGHSPREFKKVASGRTLYHWNSDAHQEY
ncbi:MAG: protein glxC [Planctomycetota bacterium]|nr:protein glxC [Planctomycetota bacterium]